MKLLLGILVVGSTATAIFGQDALPAPPVPPVPPVPPAMTIHPATAGDIIIAGVTKSAPFSADESGETIKVMPDGNRIVQTWSGRIARNAEGRIRRDVTAGQVDGASRPLIIGGSTIGPGIVAIGTGDGARHVYTTKADIEARAAGGALTLARPADGHHVSVYTTSPSEREGRELVLRKAETAAAAAPAAPAIYMDRADIIAVPAVKRPEEAKVQTRKESLGTRDFGGVQAEGTRVITTYAPGAVGNEREIEVTSEVWLSKELGVIVYSKRIDPRVGETTYQMTNIVRADPDPSLFPTK